MLVEIWSDVVCPWCYIGKRRFEQALDAFQGARVVDAFQGARVVDASYTVEVRWRSFQLDPNAPATIDIDLIDRLASKYGVSRAEAEAMSARVTLAAHEEGLAYRLDIAKPGNTFDAHRLLHYGAELGCQGQLKERLLAAYQSEGQPIADHETLVAAAVAVGIDEAAVRELLAGDRFASEVRRDEAEARELGITGVPFFVFGRRLGVSGAQSADVLLQALEQVRAGEFD